jgi:hypothetical protein
MLIYIIFSLALQVMDRMKLIEKGKISQSLLLQY